jgi:hypothetical protein
LRVCGGLFSFYRWRECQRSQGEQGQEARKAILWAFRRYWPI